MLRVTIDLGTFSSWIPAVDSRPPQARNSCSFILQALMRIVDWLSKWQRIVGQSEFARLHDEKRLWNLGAALLAVMFGLRKGYAVPVFAGGVMSLAAACLPYYHPPSVADKLVASVAEVDVELSGGAAKSNPAEFRACTAQKWVDTLLVRWGRPRSTDADKRAMLIWLGEEMKKANMRNRDIVRLAPVVFELSCLPGAGDLMAREVKLSEAAAMLRGRETA